MGFNRDEGSEKKSRRAQRGDFGQMLYGSRWISFYALLILIAFQWIVGVFYQMFPDLPLVGCVRLAFPLVFGYLTPVWLKAGERALRGRSALGDGCFSASPRSLAYATLAHLADYVPSQVLEASDPRLWPLAGLTCTAGLLLVPFLVLDGKTPGGAWRSARQAVQRRPVLVFLTLIATAGICLGMSHLIAKIWGFLAMLLIQARNGEFGGLLGQVLCWPVTSVGAYFCQMLLMAVCWLIPGPAALWIYWKSTKQKA